MSKKAFITTLQIEMVVLAETQTEAQQVAFKNMRDENVRPEDFQVYLMDAAHCAFYPAGWDDNDVLYTDGDEEMTLKEAWFKFRQGNEYE